MHFHTQRAKVVEGKGAPGFLKGSGDLDLEQGENVTKVNYSGDIQISGTIASVGQRMIQGTAKMMAAQFFTCLGAEAKTEVGETPPQHGFLRTALRGSQGGSRSCLENGSPSGLTLPDP
jgi:hypothetical protein